MIYQMVIRVVENQRAGKGVRNYGLDRVFYLLKVVKRLPELKQKKLGSKPHKYDGEEHSRYRV